MTPKLLLEVRKAGQGQYYSYVMVYFILNVWNLRLKILETMRLSIWHAAAFIRKVVLNEITIVKELSTVKIYSALKVWIFGSDTS